MAEYYLFYKKDQIAPKLKKNLFYYSVGDSLKRGYNIRVTVFGLEKKSHRPIFLGTADANTASYRGDTALANDILHQIFGYKWADKGTHYRLQNKDIKLYSV